MDDLQKLEAIMRRHAQLKTQKQLAHINWAAWNAWAYEQDEYFTWAHENAFKTQDLKARRPNANATIKYEMEEGAALYAHRALIEHELELLRHERSQHLKKLWEHQTDGKWTYSLVQIAKAYGQSPVALNTMLTGQPWFRSRLEMSGHRWREAI